MKARTMFLIDEFEYGAERDHDPVEIGLAGTTCDDCYVELILPDNTKLHFTEDEWTEFIKCAQEYASQ